MTNTGSLTWDLGWGIDYRGKLGPYRTPTSFKHRVRKCDLNCTWPIIGYTRIWYTGTSFLSKKVLQAFPRSYPYPTPSLLLFFSAHIFLRLPHDLNACNRLWKTRSAHHISAGGKRHSYKQLYVSVEFTKYGNTLFRPVIFKISVLPWFSKILEKFMYKRGIKILDKHNIIGGSLGSNWR